MTVWEVYTVTHESPSPIVVVQVERLHSTWDSLEDAMRQAGQMLGFTVRVRERFEDT